MKHVFFFGVVGVVLFSASGAQAASLYIDPARPELFRGDAITLAIRLNTDESIQECVNAVDVVLTYSDQIIPVDASIGSSILSLWVEQPTIDTVNRKITFAGGIPNGYCGRVEGDPRLTNVLAEIVFRSPGMIVGSADDSNQAQIAFAPESTVYLNDGFGTKANLTTYDSVISLSKSPGTSLQDPWREAVQADSEPPEDFSLELVRIPPETGRYHVVFTTTDKQTGISHYEIIEEPIDQLASFTWGRANAPWISVVSPYELKDQSLNSTIRVKAIDKAGNETFAVFVPEQHLRTLSLMTLVVYGLGGLLLVSVLTLVFVTLYRRRLKKREVASDTPNDNVHEEII